MYKVKAIGMNVFSSNTGVLLDQQSSMAVLQFPLSSRKTKTVENQPNHQPSVPLYSLRINWSMSILVVDGAVFE